MCALSVYAHQWDNPMDCGTEASDRNEVTCGGSLGDLCSLSTYPASWMCKAGNPNLWCVRVMLHVHVPPGVPVQYTVLVTYQYKEGTCTPNGLDENGIMQYTCSWGQPEPLEVEMDHSCETGICDGGM